MSLKPAYRFNISKRILLLTLLPLLFISIFFGGYFIQTRLEDAEKHLIERGQLLTRLIASSAEFGLMTNNQELLRSISKGPFLEADVADILFLNGRYELIERSANFSVNIKPGSPTAYKEGNYWYFTEPVVTTGISFLDNPEFQETEQIVETIGWITIIMSETNKLKQEEDIILTSMSLLFIGFMFTFFLALRFGQRISRPILELTSVMSELQKGSYSARVEMTYDAEFNALSEGLNNLAKTVETSIHTQESKIDLATRRLQATLYHLEQQNDALTKARRRADEANQAKDDFLARMSHELRTPLTSVVGFAKLLKQTQCSPDQLEHIRIINQTSQMLLSIIDDILDFSKLQQDAISLEKIQFDLEEVIYDVLEMQAPQAYEKGIELVAHLPDNSFEVVGDPTRLRQVISNLTANAVKFTDHGSVEIHVETTTINSQQTMFTIKIIDSGIGIEKAHLEQLFQAFTQADTSITRRFGGSGLGLVISKKLTELMSGKLSMVSHPKEGTTVTLYMPLRCINNTDLPTHSLLNQTQKTLCFELNASLRRAIGNMLKPQLDTLNLTRSLNECIHLAPEYQRIILGVPASQSHQPEYIETLIKLAELNAEVLALVPSNVDTGLLPDNIAILNKPIRKKLLLRTLNFELAAPEQEQIPNISQISINAVVAEDNEFNRVLIQKILNKYNITTRPACTGLEAIALVEESKPDIVIMDVHMPVMDGLEASKRIRKIYPELPIITLTANIIEHEHLALYHAGVSKVLLKPINDKELLETIYSLTKTVNTEQATDTEAAAITNLSTYDIDESQLEDELRLLASQLHSAIINTEVDTAREITHQLLGLSGLYELPDVECCSAEIHALLHQAHIDWALLWKLSWRLIRMFRQEAAKIV